MFVKSDTIVSESIAAFVASFILLFSITVAIFNEPKLHDIPLLIEGKWYERLDTVWLVYVSPEVQVQRLMTRNGYSKEDALARIQSQMLLDDKRPYADVIINNDGTPDE